jgi:hypothetical protein
MKTAAIAFTATLAIWPTGILLAQDAQRDPAAILSATREALVAKRS